MSYSLFLSFLLCFIAVTCHRSRHDLIVHNWNPFFLKFFATKIIKVIVTDNLMLLPILWESQISIIYAYLIKDIVTVMAENKIPKIPKKLFSTIFFLNKPSCNFFIKMVNLYSVALKKGDFLKYTQPSKGSLLISHYGYKFVCSLKQALFYAHVGCAAFNMWCLIKLLNGGKFWK